MEFTMTQFLFNSHVNLDDAIKCLILKSVFLKKKFGEIDLFFYCLVNVAFCISCPSFLDLIII